MNISWGFFLESWTKYYSWTLFVNHKKIIQWVKLTKIHSAAYVEVSCLMPTGAGLSRSPPSVKQKLLSAVMINTSGSPPLPVTPKEYYRDYPDTVSILSVEMIFKIFIYSAPQCNQFCSSNSRQILRPYCSVLMGLALFRSVQFR